MKKIKLFIISLTLLLSGISCGDFLDQVPDEQLSNAILFQSKDDVVKVLTQAYSYWYSFLDFPNYIGNAADEVDYNWNDYATHYKDIGNFGPGTPRWNHWSRYYEAIRTCQTFLARIDECQDEKLTGQERTWWTGEAEFLQAYYYFLLLQQYGPVPKIDHVYEGAELESAIQTGIPRAHADTIAKYIDHLLVSAAGKLDTIYALPDRAGRANASAAHFLRSRLALYLASPLYNGQSSVTHPGKEYAELVPTNHDDTKLLNTTFDSERWKRAMEISDQAIKVADKGGHVLLRLSTTTNSLEPSGYGNYKRIFSYPRGGEPSSEMVYYKQNFGTNGGTGWGITHAAPLSWGGTYSGICPTIEHVEEYFMANGLMPEDDPDYQTIQGYGEVESKGGSSQSKRFLKREPRFYANILYPGRNKYSVRTGGTNADPTAITESESIKWAAESDAKCYFQPFNTGQDGFSKKSGRDFCNTGILLCKWIAVTSTASQKGDFGTPHFRYTELYLNYIEAAIEYYTATGQQAVSHEEIFTRWDALRDRAGLPGIREAYARIGVNTLSNDKLRELIRRERRVELANEGHRYFDNRRWLDAEREGGEKHGFDISQDPPSFYNVIAFETRYWDDKMYFQPIPQTEIDKNRALKQNPMY
ncbi:MAG: RagB/SusD family nutrient uptake outer membrane protein [Odoribacteraceae bacterium]|jgi:hypothetical protein|nr:RagB/SusD family nutrient uptake outer membrane protein [Odoribacteraceae bacterium]